MADTYTVVTQEETQTFAADGTVTESMKVTFQATASQQRAYVTIPVADYTVEAVDTAIRARVAVIDAVQAL